MQRINNRGREWRAGVARMSRDVRRNDRRRNNFVQSRPSPRCRRSFFFSPRDLQRSSVSRFSDGSECRPTRIIKIVFCSQLMISRRSADARRRPRSFCAAAPDIEAYSSIASTCQLSLNARRKHERVAIQIAAKIRARVTRFTCGIERRPLGGDGDDGGSS